MALTDEGSGNGFYMPVAPAYGGGYGNNGGFGFGGDWAWILLLLLLGGNGWGGGFGLGGFGGAMMADGYGLYPWLNNSQHISDGFRDQMLQTSISSLSDKVTSGFGDVATQLCGGFANVNSNIANASAQAEISANARAMNNMQQLFGVQSALQNCCCENRAGLADLKYTVATENCADRAAISDGIRDILVNQTANTQRILDQMCNDKIDAKNEKIADLERQLTMANLQASQVAQTAQLERSNGDVIEGLYNRLVQCPVPSQPVYGSQPIFTCPQNNNNGCGCGCGGNNF